MTDTDIASVQPSDDPEADPILQGLIALIRLLEQTADTETIVAVHSAIMTRCTTLGLDFDAVERRFLGMNFDTDFPEFN